MRASTIEDFEILGDPEACLSTGDVRGNVSPHLMMIQIIFALEHNFWAEEILKAYPYLEDERVFQEARRRTIAVL